MNRFNRRNVKIAAIVIGIPAIAVAWWLGSPLFIDSEVNEAFPVPAAAEDQTEIELTTAHSGHHRHYDTPGFYHLDERTDRWTHHPSDG